MSRRHKIVLAAGLLTVAAAVGFLVWFFRVTGSAASSMAKAKEIYQSKDSTYGELIARYEEAVGVNGTWEAKRINEEHWPWSVIYHHPNLGTLWFGVQTRSAVYMDDTSPGTTARMLTATGGR